MCLMCEQDALWEAFLDQERAREAHAGPDDTPNFTCEVDAAQAALAPKITKEDRE